MMFAPPTSQGNEEGKGHGFAPAEDSLQRPPSDHLRKGAELGGLSAAGRAFRQSETRACAKTLRLVPGAGGGFTHLSGWFPTECGQPQKGLATPNYANGTCLRCTKLEFIKSCCSFHPLILKRTYHYWIVWPEVKVQASGTKLVRRKVGPIKRLKGPIGF